MIQKMSYDLKNDRVLIKNDRVLIKNDEIFLIRNNGTSILKNDKNF